jgi:hypothetical protein
MSSTGVHIDFGAPAILRKWPALNKRAHSASLGARPYLIGDATMDECIRQFQSVTQRHLRDSHRAANYCAPDARSTGSRHSSFGFDQWMLRYSVRG